MTQTEAYDLACLTVKDPAVLMMGDECVIGVWLPLAECGAVILRAKERGVVALGRGSTWEEAIERAGLTNPPPVLARKESVLCTTPGCGEMKKADDPFCPKCFEEHRDDRELHLSPRSQS